jgi:hypothetical protein
VCPRSLRLEIIQYSLKKLTDALIQSLHFPEAFDDIVCHLWLMYMSIFNADLRDRSMIETLWNPSQAQEFNDSDVSIQDDTETEDSTSTRSSLSAPDFPKSNIAFRQQQRMPENDGFQLIFKDVSPQTSLAILYIASRILRLPVFIGDFTKWANTGKIPYFFTEKDIPESLKQGYNLRYAGIECKVRFLAIFTTLERPREIRAFVNGIDAILLTKVQY